MATVTCYVADFDLGPTDPVINDLSLEGQPAGSYFKQASGSAELDLTLDWSRRGHFPGLIDSDGVYDDELKDGLGRLLRPSGTSSDSPIGLLLADRYGPAGGQYGIMFDIDGREGAFGPRQGCAVFVSAIKLAITDAGLDENAFRKLVAYTAVHEIGHAFNLWHVENSSFMKAHPNAGNPGPCNFDPTHAQYLALAADPATAQYVLPGRGRALFGIRPDGWPAGEEQPFETPQGGRANLAIKIALSHATFWPFEPVEVVVEVSLVKGKTRRASVPDEIDPGYSSFQIWLTRPDGERFRFRPQTRFCQGNGQRWITPNRPFRRDIAIFRQSGGYTFTAPGRYELQVALRLESGRFLWSNKTECEVLPADPSSEAWIRASTLLQSVEARNLLRYKRRVPAHHSYARIKEFADKEASGITAGAIHYALGKAFTRTLARNPNGGRAKEFVRRSEAHFRRALALGNLSKHRITSTNTCLRELKDLAG